MAPEEDIEIDLIDIALSLLEQWKAVILISVVSAVIICLGKYAVDIQRQEADRAELAEVVNVSDGTVNIDKLKKEEQKAVLETVDIYKDYAFRKEYLDNSIWINLDPMNYKSYEDSFRFRLKDKDGDVNSLVSAYNKLGNDERLYKIVGEDLGLDKEMRYIKELVSISAYQDAQTNVLDKEQKQPDSGMISVSVILPDGEGTDVEVINKLKKDLDKYIKSANKDISSKWAGHTIKPFYSGINKYMVRENANNRSDTQYKVTELSNSSQEAYNALTPKEQKIVEIILLNDGYVDLIEKDSEEESDSETEPRTTAEVIEFEHVKPSVKHLVLGFAVGMFMYAGIFVGLVIVRRRLRNEHEITDYFRVRSFGGIYQYPYRGGLSRFTHDSRVYGLRHKNACNTVDVADTFLAKIRHLQYEHITMIGIGIPSDEEKSVINTQCDHLRNAGIECEVITSGDNRDAFREEMYNRIDSVLLIFFRDKTRLSDAREVMNRLREYDIDIVGGELIEA